MTGTATTSLTFLQAAEKALEAIGESRTAELLAHWALQNNVLVSKGKTPAATMEALVATSIKERGETSPFVRTAPSTFALRRWIAEGKIAAPAPAGAKGVRVPHFPDYASMRAALPLFAGLERSEINELQGAMEEHKGTWQETVDWTDPDSWIPERLSGRSREVALHIWKGSGGVVNPRHMTGHWLLATGYDLLADSAGGTLVLTKRGKDFLEHPSGSTTRDLDEREGLLKLLALVAELGPASSKSLLEPYMAYLRTASRNRSENTARSVIYYRLRNLAARQYIERSGLQYQATPAGLAYLKASGFADRGTKAGHSQKMLELAAEQRSAVRDALRERLGEMDPYDFEHLIKRLLVEMGYTDVEVTAASGDRGVDVTGKIEVGITDIREVVQVKRHKKNIHRPVLDGLRGSLHRFHAVRGTIITLGGFAKGTQDAAIEMGAAPITLIDGEKLLDLLIRHGIGVRTKPIELLELDEGSLEGDEGEEQ